MKTEMRKLNRVKYAYSEEEKKRLMEDGYKISAAIEPKPDKEDGQEKEIDAVLPEPQEPAEKKEGTKKK